MKFTSVILFTLLTGATFASANESELLRNRVDSSKRTQDRELQAGTRTKINDSGDATTTKFGDQLTMAALETTGVQARIVGGEPVDAGTFPFYVHVANDQLCGGSLIHPDIVLTAAHCQDVWINNAIIGSTDITGRDGAPQIPIETLLPHPDYIPADNGEVEVNDIMIVKLESPSDAPVISLNFNEFLPIDGSPVTVMGFGQTSDGGPVSEELLGVEVTNYNFDVCEVNLAGLELFPESQLCAGELAGGSDSCAGDSGGPLIDSVRSPPVQYGIVSFGIGCAEPDTPAVYTRVSFYQEFIRNAICDLSDDPPEDCATEVPTGSPTIAPTRATTSVVPTTPAPTPDDTGAGPVTVAPTPDDTGAGPVTVAPTPEGTGAGPVTAAPTPEDTGAGPATAAPTPEDTGPEPATAAPTIESTPVVVTAAPTPADTILATVAPIVVTPTPPQPTTAAPAGPAIQAPTAIPPSSAVGPPVIHVRPGFEKDRRRKRAKYRHRHKGKGKGRSKGRSKGKGKGKGRWRKKKPQKGIFTYHTPYTDGEIFGSKYRDQDGSFFRTAKLNPGD